MIAKHIQFFERLHPFPDLNGRTFVNALLNRMLMQNGLGLAIFEEPNLFDLYAVSELVDVIKKAIKNGEKIIEGDSLFGFDTHCMSEVEKERFAKICLPFTEGMTIEKEKKYQGLMKDFKLANYLEHHYKNILDRHYEINKNDIEQIKKQYRGYTYERLYNDLSHLPVVKELKYLKDLHTRFEGVLEGKCRLKDIRLQLEMDILKMLRDKPADVFCKPAMHDLLNGIISDLDDIWDCSNPDFAMKQKQDQIRGYNLF